MQGTCCGSILVGNDFVQDEEFWFEDGNIILIAGRTKFKMYQGILAKCSPVFKAMFTLPQPETDDSACPEVELYDLAEDLREFFRLIIPNGIEDGSKDPSYAAISAWVLIGHKYRIDFLLNKGLKILRSCYSTSYYVFIGNHGPFFDPGSCINVVHLARLTGHTGMLPTALYHCAILPPSLLVGGFQARPDRPVEQLSERDLALCISARDLFSRTNAKRVFKALIGKGIKSCGHAECVAARKKIGKRAEEHPDLVYAPTVFMPFDPPSPFTYESPTGLLGNGVCHEYAWERDEDITEDMWKRLPAVQDKEFWFEDGNIVLIAGKTKFKMYKGLLAQRSPVFANMFSFPQPAATNVIGGDECPRVELYDSPEDLRQLFRALMFNGQKMGLIGDTFTYADISALILTGHKYEIDFLVKIGIEKLRYYYPTNFYFSLKIQDPPLPEACSCIAVVNIARLTGNSSMLPYALYLCAKLPADDLVRGFSARPDRPLDQLSPTDLARCITARTKLSMENMKRLLALVPRSSCKEIGCQGFRDHVRRQMDEEPESAFSPAVFDHWLEFIPDDNMCEECADEVDSGDKYYRAQLWGRLPELVGVREEISEWY
ncbi:uncharacterized protein BXZ73DRAFT_53737 [Epithele typhae]|uniref:uncharacterized protein n=1 Tax=Epithele typhae TaxID=378194 RepID=UPI0020077AAB|nr:uncharacterized protein BXZ73DRAFT_53737 [Epithele typhae]KAH9916597.1 hypothetical protein BXZ73DRAFT_53737 [Epithele typhae]